MVEPLPPATRIECGECLRSSGIDALLVRCRRDDSSVSHPCRHCRCEGCRAVRRAARSSRAARRSSAVRTPSWFASIWSKRRSAAWRARSIYSSFGDIAAPRSSARGRLCRIVGLGKRREAQREDKGNQNGAHLGTSAVRNACDCISKHVAEPWIAEQRPPLAFYEFRLGLVTRDKTALQSWPSLLLTCEDRCSPPGSAISRSPASPITRARSSPRAISSRISIRRWSRNTPRCSDRRLIEPGTGKLIFSFHSFVVKTGRHTILIDACIGNDKERPTRPQFHRMNSPFIADLAAPRGQAGGRRLRDVHASALGPCRLEHPARRRRAGSRPSRTRNM